MTLPGDARIGRVGLAVADIERVAEFYESVAGLQRQGAATGAALGAGEGTLLSLRPAPTEPDRPDDAAGLFHLALRYPTRESLAAALARLREGWQLDGASDHLVSEALYADDPEGNGVECYRDRPREEWSRTPDGGIEMDTLPLDVEDLAAELDGGPPATAPPTTDVGHVHLEVTDLDAACRFYVEALGFEEMARYRGGLFVGAGGYHHHVGLNVWNGRSAPASGRGLDWFEVVLPEAGARSAAVDRLREAGYDVERAGDEVDANADGVDPDGHAVDPGGDAVIAHDPDGIELRLVVK